MESFINPALTFAIHRLLARFIKKAGGSSGSSAANLRASLKGGHVVLKNLELDLSSLLQGLPLQPTRAFAGQLKLDVPWTALSSQPTRVQLDNVEIALDMGACSPHGAAGGDADPGIFADAPPEPPAKRKADWFGLQETMKGIASRMEVAISNLILRVSSCGVTAVAVVPSVLVSNVDDPASAVAKALRIAQASLSIQVDPSGELSQRGLSKAACERLAAVDNSVLVVSGVEAAVRVPKGGNASKTSKNSRRAPSGHGGDGGVETKRPLAIDVSVEMVMATCTTDHLKAAGAVLGALRRRYQARSRQPSFKVEPQPTGKAAKPPRGGALDLPSGSVSLPPSPSASSSTSPDTTRPPRAPEALSGGPKSTPGPSLTAPSFPSVSAPAIPGAARLLRGSSDLPRGRVSPPPSAEQLQKDEAPRQARRGVQGRASGEGGASRETHSQKKAQWADSDNKAQGLQRAESEKRGVYHALSSWMSSVFRGDSTEVEGEDADDRAVSAAGESGEERETGSGGDLSAAWADFLSEGGGHGGDMAETLSPRSLPSVSEANLSLRFSSLTVNLLTPCEGLERQPPGGQPPESAASVADLLRYHLAAAVTATGVAAGVNRDHAGEIARASLELTSAQISSLESVVETEAGNAAGADQAAEAHEAGLKEAPGQLRRAKLCPRVLPVTVKGTRGVVAVPADDEALASFLAPWLRLRPAGTSDRRGDGRAGGGRVAASFLWESPDRRCPPSASRAECRATVGDVTACVRPGSTGPLRQFLACVSAATSRASWPDTEAAESTPPAASLGALSASASLDALRLVLCAHSAPRPAALALCIDGVSLDGARDAPDAAHSSPPLRLEAGLGALSASLVGSARLWGGTCGFSSESDMDAAPVLRGAASSISFSSGARGASWSAEFGPIDVSVGAERWATAAAVAAGAMATIGPPECKKVLEIGGRRTGEGRDGGEGGEEEDVHGCAPTGTLRVRVHGASMSGSKAPQGSAHVQCHVSSFVGAVSVRSLSAVGPTSAASCYFRASGIALASGGETAGVAADVKRARVWLSGSAADVEELVDALGEETGGPDAVLRPLLAVTDVSATAHKSIAPDASSLAEGSSVVPLHLSATRTLSVGSVSFDYSPDHCSVLEVLFPSLARLSLAPSKPPSLPVLDANVVAAMRSGGTSSTRVEFSVEALQGTLRLPDSASVERAIMLMSPQQEAVEKRWERRTGEGDASREGERGGGRCTGGSDAARAKRSLFGGVAEGKERERGGAESAAEGSGMGGKGGEGGERGAEGENRMPGGASVGERSGDAMNATRVAQVRAGDTVDVATGRINIVKERRERIAIPCSECPGWAGLGRCDVEASERVSVGKELRMSLRSASDSSLGSITVLRLTSARHTGGSEPGPDGPSRRTTGGGKSTVDSESQEGHARGASGGVGANTALSVTRTWRGVALRHVCCDVKEALVPLVKETAVRTGNVSLLLDNHLLIALGALVPSILPSRPPHGAQAPQRDGCGREDTSKAPRFAKAARDPSSLESRANIRKSPVGVAKGAQEGAPQTEAPCRSDGASESLAVECPAVALTVRVSPESSDGDELAMSPLMAPARAVEIQLVAVAVSSCSSTGEHSTGAETHGHGAPSNGSYPGRERGGAPRDEMGPVFQAPVRVVAKSAWFTVKSGLLPAGGVIAVAPVPITIEFRTRQGMEPTEKRMEVSAPFLRAALYDDTPGALTEACLVLAGASRRFLNAKSPESLAYRPPKVYDRAADPTTEALWERVEATAKVCGTSLTQREAAFLVCLEKQADADAALGFDRVQDDLWGGAFRLGTLARGGGSGNGSQSQSGVAGRPKLSSWWGLFSTAADGPPAGLRGAERSADSLEGGHLTNAEPVPIAPAFKVVPFHGLGIRTADGAELKGLRGFSWSYVSPRTVDLVAVDAGVLQDAGTPRLWAWSPDGNCWSERVLVIVARNASLRASAAGQDVFATRSSTPGDASGNHGADCACHWALSWGIPAPSASHTNQHGDSAMRDPPEADALSLLRSVMVNPGQMVRIGRINPSFDFALLADRHRVALLAPVPRPNAPRAAPSPVEDGTGGAASRVQEAVTALGGSMGARFVYWGPGRIGLAAFLGGSCVAAAGPARLAAVPVATLGDVAVAADSANTRTCPVDAVFEDAISSPLHATSPLPPDRPAAVLAPGTPPSRPGWSFSMRVASRRSELLPGTTESMARARDAQRGEEGEVPTIITGTHQIKALTDAASAMRHARALRAAAKERRGHLAQGESGPHKQGRGESPASAQAIADVVVRNMCPGAIAVAQMGSAGERTEVVHPGTSRAFWMRVVPDGSALGQGHAWAVQLAGHGGDTTPGAASRDSRLAWGAPVPLTHHSGARSVSLQVLLWPGGVWGVVSVHLMGVSAGCVHENAPLALEIRPALTIANCMAEPLRLKISGCWAVPSAQGTKNSASSPPSPPFAAALATDVNRGGSPHSHESPATASRQSGDRAPAEHRELSKGGGSSGRSSVSARGGAWCTVDVAPGERVGVMGGWVGHHSRADGGAALLEAALRDRKALSAVTKVVVDPCEAAADWHMGKGPGTHGAGVTCGREVDWMELLLSRESWAQDAELFCCFVEAPTPSDPCTTLSILPPLSVFNAADAAVDVVLCQATDDSREAGETGLANPGACGRILPGAASEGMPSGAGGSEGAATHAEASRIEPACEREASAVAAPPRSLVAVPLSEPLSVLASALSGAGSAAARAVHGPAAAMRLHLRVGGVLSTGIPLLSLLSSGPAGAQVTVAAPGTSLGTSPAGCAAVIHVGIAHLSPRESSSAVLWVRPLASASNLTMVPLSVRVGAVGADGTAGTPQRMLLLPGNTSGFAMPATLAQIADSAVHDGKGSSETPFSVTVEAADRSLVGSATLRLQGCSELHLKHQGGPGTADRRGKPTNMALVLSASVVEFDPAHEALLRLSPGVAVAQRHRLDGASLTSPSTLRTVNVRLAPSVSLRNSTGVALAARIVVQGASPAPESLISAGERLREPLAWPCVGEGAGGAVVGATLDGVAFASLQIGLPRRDGSKRGESVAEETRVSAWSTPLRLHPGALAMPVGPRRIAIQAIHGGHHFLLVSVAWHHGQTLVEISSDPKPPLSVTNLTGVPLSVALSLPVTSPARPGAFTYGPPIGVLQVPPGASRRADLLAIHRLHEFHATQVGIDRAARQRSLAAGQPQSGAILTGSAAPDAQIPDESLSEVFPGTSASIITAIGKDTVSGDPWGVPVMPKGVEPQSGLALAGSSEAAVDAFTPGKQRVFSASAMLLVLPHAPALIDVAPSLSPSSWESSRGIPCSPGTHRIGDVVAEASRDGSTLSVVLRPAQEGGARGTDGSTALAAAERAMRAKPATSLSAAISAPTGLRVVVLDDDTGSVGRSAPHADLLSLSASFLSVSLKKRDHDRSSEPNSRAIPSHADPRNRRPGIPGPGSQAIALSATIRGIHLDSYLERSSAPVVLSAAGDVSVSAVMRKSATPRGPNPKDVGGGAEISSATEGEGSPSIDRAHDANGECLTISRAAVSLPEMTINVDDALVDAMLALGGMVPDRGVKGGVGGRSGRGAQSGASKTASGEQVAGQQQEARGRSVVPQIVERGESEQRGEDEPNGGRKGPLTSRGRVNGGERDVQEREGEAWDEVEAWRRGPIIVVEQMEVSPVRATVTAHVRAIPTGPRVPIDLVDAPVALSGLRITRLCARQADLLKAIGAHYAGEAIINVPRLLGSLDLILNPAGILTGLTRGVSDMMLLPYKGLSENSIGGLLAGIGQGSVSLVSHVASSTFSSIGGFSSAIAHVIDTATSAAPRPRGPTRGAQAGAASLSGSQSSGVLNAVAAPLTGTLAFVGSVTRSIGVSVRDMAAPGPQWRMPPASRSRLDAAERPRWDADAWAAASGICREACRAQAGGRCDVVPGVVVPVDAVSVGAGSGASGGICSLGGGTAVVLLEARMVALLARSGGGVGRAACMGVVHLEGAQCAVVSEDGGSTVGREELGESALEVELVPVVGSLWKAASGEEGGVEASADPGDSVVMRMRSSEWAVLRGALVACGVLTP